MEQLKRIPFTELKIDRAFVYGAVNDSGARAILESSLDIAERLKMESVAEGAETREDWDLVEELGCDYVQGFYCAKPMPNDELLQFLNDWSGPHKTG
jgi:EAL domain-containing protein (putative c-di-GMP-specific phosphodiesterase class I)